MWETPLFERSAVDKLSMRRGSLVPDESLGCVRIDLSECYKGTDEAEEVSCGFLDSEKGCMLSEEDKPFDCKIWPLRIMNRDGELVIALTPTCPAINEVPTEVMKKLVDDGLGETIAKYATEHPYIVKPYREGFPILMRVADNLTKGI